MNPTNSDDQPLYVRRRKRLKVDLACEICRRRKVKCDGGRPGLVTRKIPHPRRLTDRYSACGNCSKRPALQGKCIYTPSGPECLTGSPSARDSHPSLEKTPSESRHGRESVQPPKPGVLQQPKIFPSPASREQLLPLPVTPSQSRSCTDGRESREHFGRSSSIVFTEQIQAAIDARSGATVQAQSPIAMPMVDVPLFPSHQDDAVIDGLADGMEYELPPRKQADYLVHTYWSLVDPLFPVLSRPRFMHSYGSFVAGTMVNTNERIFVTTLNVIFALSIQLQESLVSHQRERLSGKYFQRAQDLLRLPVWETGSIDLIQCLLILSQYLQCTNKPHQTWMVVGSAVRIAQGLGLHLPEIWTTSFDDESVALKRRVWQACIMMDRYEDQYAKESECSCSFHIG